MTKMIKAFQFGSCGLHDAPYVLAPLGFFFNTLGLLGFNSAPYALTSGAAVQLYDFCVGERLLSESVKMLAYMTKNQPTSATRHLMDDIEIGFIELSSPIEPLIGEDVVNFNRIMDFVIQPLRNAGVDLKVLSGWSKSLVNVKDDLRERAQALLAVWPEDVADGESVRFAVEALHSRRLSVDEMVRNLEALRERMRKPLAMKFYDFRYMPDGRLVDWPTGFKAEQAEVARRIGVPILDMAPVVERVGIERLLPPGTYAAHWIAKTRGLQAELMYDFWAETLGRPYLETYPEWLAAKPKLFEAFPDFSDIPARIAFPNMTRLPQSSASPASAAMPA